MTWAWGLCPGGWGSWIAKSAITFDPEKHNAVMHIDDENLGENVVAQVFQAGFSMGDKVIRHAIVQVAN